MTAIQEWIYYIPGYYDRGNKCRQLRLQSWNSFIGQFVHPVGREGIGWLRGFVILQASYSINKFYKKIMKPLKVRWG